MLMCFIYSALVIMQGMRVAKFQTVNPYDAVD